VKKDFLLLSRIIEGQYPNYDQVIPSSFNTTIIIQSQILEETLERARIMPTDDKLKIQHVQFSLGKDEVIINSYSDIMGEIKEVIENVTIEGQNEQRIAFNTNYFLDVVKLLSGECEEIVIKLSSSQGPAMILNPNKDNYLYILVPLRTSN
jgi:DNA polymerase-3 subunit beta